MTPDPNQAKALFLQALEEHTPQQWPAFLDAACAGRPELRSRVEILLAAHQEAGTVQQRSEGPASVGDNNAGDRAGNVIGYYKLLQQIGEGGMGTVWMAEQLQPVQRKVALKLIKPGMDSRQVLARFEAERQALALMDHPNIAKVLDAGTAAGGRLYFVMELVKGVALTRYCDEQHLTPRQRLELFIPVCQAVQHAHQKGIIHRDLKPSNVMVCLYDGRPAPKVIDFGVAKATGPKLTERTLFTEFGAVIGTFEYMSPEQAELNQLDVDTRSDIYSLGVLLYELLTGTTPLERQRRKQTGLLDVLRIIREEEPPTPSARLSQTRSAEGGTRNDPSVPRSALRAPRWYELDWIVMKCLEKDRNRRYETANGLATDLQRYLADEPVLAHPPSVAYRFGKFARRNKMVLVTAALVAAALVLGTVASTWQWSRAVEAEGLADERFQAETEARRKADTAFLQAQQRLFDAKLAEARANRLSRQVGQRFESLTAIREAAQLASALKLGADQVDLLRTEAIACLALADLRPLKKAWEGWPDGSSGDVGWDANLEHYARSDDAGNISVRRVADDKELALLAGWKNSGSQLMRFSPDGTLLAVLYWQKLPGTSTNCAVWDWRRQRLLYQPRNVGGRAVTFSCDGQWLVLGHDDGTVSVNDATTGEPSKHLKVGFVPFGLAPDPSGRRLAVSGMDQHCVAVHDLDAGDLLVKLHYPKATVSHIAWHPDGELLAAGCNDHSICLWDVRTGQQHKVLQGHQNNGIRVAFHSGGGLLLSWSWDETARLWNPWTGRQLLSFAASDCQFSLDNSRLAIQNGAQLRVWELASGDEYRTLMTPGDAYADGHGGVSPDGRWLAYATREGVQFWDLGFMKLCGMLSTGFTAGAHFHPKRQDLFTTGPSGLFRWPYGVKGDALHVGPAETLMAIPGPRQCAMSAQGPILAVSEYHGPRLMNVDTPTREPLRCDHLLNTSVTVSPDAKWLASGQGNGYGAKVWDVKTARLVADLLPQARGTAVVFSPDGRWLVTCTSREWCFWEVGTWQAVRRIPRLQDGYLAGPIAFSANQELLAVGVTRDLVRLVHPATARDLATLRSPDADEIQHLHLTPDCGYLITRTLGPARLQVWDLRRVRAQLRDLGLDWDQPALAPPVQPGVRQPLRLQVD
jgi:serine/threonine protein kinase/WD40 repeat protein